MALSHYVTYVTEKSVFWKDSLKIVTNTYIAFTMYQALFLRTLY